MFHHRKLSMKKLSSSIQLRVGLGSRQQKENNVKVGLGNILFVEGATLTLVHGMEVSMLDGLLLDSMS